MSVVIRGGDLQLRPNALAIAAVSLIFDGGAAFFRNAFHPVRIRLRGGELVMRPLPPEVTTVSLVFDNLAQIRNSVVFAVSYRLQVGARLGGFKVAEYCLTGKASAPVIVLAKVRHVCD